MRSPHKVARVLLAFVLYSTIFLDRWEYSKAYQGNPDSWMDVIRGTAVAPQQYRIGVERAADLLQRHGHLALRHGFVLIDAFSAVVAVYLLFWLFTRTGVYREANEMARWFGAAAFVFLTQYYFAWIAWYQRPETLASTAVLAATLWLLSVRLPLPRGVAVVVTSAAMLALAGIQGFIRPDVIFAVHLGIFLVCLTSAGKGFSMPRGAQAVTSVLAVLISGGIQYYLMHVVYPHASYGTTPVIELALNIMRPVRWVPFVPFMLPTAWLTITLIRGRARAEAPGLALAIGSAIYAVMWFVVGSIDEVRIFLPYALALIPLTCACAMRRFAGQESEQVRA
ncbi:MAG: hypothetical protein ABSG84_14440 [Acidobacteriaceae bacterium]|jgi:hypothetical protein